MDELYDYGSEFGAILKKRDKWFISIHEKKYIETIQNKAQQSHVHISWVLWYAHSMDTHLVEL